MTPAPIPFGPTPRGAPASPEKAAITPAPDFTALLVDVDGMAQGDERGRSAKNAPALELAPNLNPRAKTAEPLPTDDARLAAPATAGEPKTIAANKSLPADAAPLSVPAAPRLPQPPEGGPERPIAAENPQPPATQKPLAAARTPPRPELALRETPPEPQAPAQPSKVEILSHPVASEGAGSAREVPVLERTARPVPELQQAQELQQQPTPVPQRHLVEQAVASTAPEAAQRAAPQSDPAPAEGMPQPRSALKKVIAQRHAQIQAGQQGAHAPHANAQANGPALPALENTRLVAATLVRQETHRPPVAPNPLMSRGQDAPLLQDLAALPDAEPAKKPSFSAIAAQLRAALDQTGGDGETRAPAAQPHAALAQGSAKYGAPVRLVELSLQPATLGAVSVTLRLTGSGVRVTIAASSRETADILEQEREALSGLIADAGYTPDDVTVSLRPGMNAGSTRA